MKLQKNLKVVKFLAIVAGILCLAFLSGCANRRFADSSVKNSEFARGNKSIVIMRAGSRFDALIFKGSVPVWVAIAKVDSRYPDKKTRLSYLNEDLLLRRDFLMIEPGTYVLDKASYTLGDTEYLTTLDGLNPGTEHFVYGGFKAKPGEIIYLGDLNFDFSTNSLSITAIDNFDSAIKAFLKKYPEFSSYQIKKKLLCPRGTMLKDM